MKIVLVSDNHGAREPLHKILCEHNDGEFYLHCGDSEMKQEELRPFVSVNGNNDYGLGHPEEKVMEISNHRILLLHGHRYIFMNSIEPLLERAEKLACDIVFFGHTHLFCDRVIRGIHLINPGSCYYNRDHSKPSYAIVEIDKEKVFVKKYELD